eukprot:CAMPEP_0185330564 /NCGR_PEP_ID=MMETSP1363-20130426/77527_1 /TAXON_ID=38817 /ORGANISM="Gephyrocapsa oceanica, Strain RCC1303" /LENGTH=309 /DNA_ID=CAMNT_0027929421 /DNA_START=42 /DNA_END=971 /DNA_ORIENTATION=-
MADNVDDFVAGWVSGAVATLATQPFDMAVTRMQATTHQPGPTLASLRSLMRLDGASLGAAWRGVGPLLLGTPFNNALIFVGYGSGKRFSESGDETPNSLLPVFIGGCVGGFAQSFLASPVELIKVRLQLAEPGGGVGGGRGLAAAGALVKELAAAGHSHTLPPLLSQGLAATIARDVVPHGVWFASYEVAKTALAPSRPIAASAEAPDPQAPGPPLSTGRQLAAGASAAVAAWAVGYPFDIVKTRCQASSSSEGFLAATRQLWREGGVAAMYSGFGLKMCRAVPMSAIGFLVYEHVYATCRRLRGADGE